MNGKPSIARAMQRIADMKIEEAIANGEFDNLAGLSKPLAHESFEFDPNAWALRKIRLEEIGAVKQQKASESGGKDDDGCQNSCKFR